MDIFTAHLKKSQPLHLQICDHIRTLITTGELTPGSRLPSTHLLAASWHTAPRTVHLALVALEKEGLLARHHGKGTFVRQRQERLTRVAIYEPASILSKSLYLQALQAALQEELFKAGIEADLWMDPRPEEQQRHEAWLPLVQAVERREFQALIVTCTNPEAVRWQRKLPVPVATGGGPADMPNRVMSDLNQFVDLSLQVLARQGCRSVGLITPITTNPPYEGGIHPHYSFLERFTHVSRDLGLTIKNEWMRVARYEDWVAVHLHETFGYQQFLELWKQGTGPQGLVVFDDVTARGVILALREKQVRVPEVLKLVLHKNESIDLLCPMPATFLVYSERATARALIEQVQRQFRGERCEPIVLPFRVMTRGAGGE